MDMPSFANKLMRDVAAAQVGQSPLVSVTLPREEAESILKTLRWALMHEDALASSDKRLPDALDSLEKSITQALEA